MIQVSSVNARDGFELEILFSDGTRGVVSLKARLFGPIFEPLRDPSYFEKVAVDEFGALCWPIGADLAPDALYERICAAAVA